MQITGERSRTNNQSGFSLVELMVVVAIIGILASVAVPQFQKFQNKAKQSEASGTLSALFTAETSFFSQWNDYSPRFGDIGFAPTGRLKYYCGSSSGYTSPTAVANGFTLTISPPGVNVETFSYCNSSGGSCTSSIEATQAQVTGGWGVQPVVSATAFLLVCESKLNASNGNFDVWSIDQNKKFFNNVNGL